MAKVDFKRVLAASKVALKEHSPEVLTGIGIAGFLTTVVLAVKATPRALDSIEWRKRELGFDLHERLPVKEIVRSCWKCYTPAVLLAAASTGCVIGGVSTSIRRTAAMATVAKVAETTLQEYSQKVAEEIGEEKEKQIKEKAAVAAVEKTRVDEQTLPPMYGKQQLYCDCYSKRVFYATAADVERAIGELNTELAAGEVFSLNDFHSCFHLDDCPSGEIVGWIPTQRNVKIGYSLSSAVSFDGRAVLVINFDVWPSMFDNS